MNVFKRDHNILKYKGLIELSERNEKFARYCEIIKEKISKSPYFVNMGDNDFNRIGYFYFQRQQNSKKDVIYIEFKDTAELYKLALSAKLKKLDIAEIDTLCEVFFSDDEIENAVSDFESTIKQMLEACGINYEIARIKD